MKLPRKDGTHAPADLGIGFVQNFSGERLTSIGGGRADMPNNGDAKYKGSWVANCAVGRMTKATGLIALEKRRCFVDGRLRQGHDQSGPGRLGHAVWQDLAGNEFSGEEGVRR